MERLNLSERPEFSSIEESIHLARYANILPFVKDKIVLDIACGEGYGSALMMRAGAKQVIGVDISEEAINKAKQNFYKSGVEYIQANAEELIGFFKEKTFDIIVSIETIEHVEDDVKYLKAIKQVAKDDAIFLVTCPNDYWYFKEDDQSNPFHLRKYNFDDFKKITTNVFGHDVQWALGGPIFGFGSVPYEDQEYVQLDESWFRITSTENNNFSIINQNKINNPTTLSNCSYFIGIWNVKKINYGSSYFGVGMDAYEDMFSALAFDSINELKKTNEKLKKEINKLNLINISLDSENSCAKNKINELYNINSEIKKENEEMRVGYWRYRRITDKIPKSFKKIVNFLRGK